jgi:hypothetical protein
MSSIPTAASIFKQLTSITLYRTQPTSPGDTLTTAALARLAATIPVAAITGFADTEPFVIQGDGGTELNAVSGAPAGLNIIPARPIALVQSSGARVLEMIASAAGHIVEGSAKIAGTSSTTPILAATSATPIGFLSNAGALTFAFGLLGFDSRSLAMTFGQEENETGAGSSADPYQIPIGQSSVGTHGLLCARARGIRKDGKIIEVDMCDMTITVAADVNISGKAVTPISVAGSMTGAIVRIWS